MTRGLPGLMGVDVSGRIGMGDKFLPLQPRDWPGPWANTMQNAVRHGRENTTFADQVRNISPGLGNPAKAFEAWQNEGVITNPWKRGRPEYEATGGELIMKGRWRAPHW